MCGVLPPHSPGDTSLRGEDPTDRSRPASNETHKHIHFGLLQKQKEARKVGSVGPVRSETGRMCFLELDHVIKIACGFETT